MSKLILLFAILSLFSIASAVTSEDLPNLWGAWKTAHNKRYLPSEEDHRFMVFQENVAKVAQLNAEYVGAKFAVNQFSDLTSEEFKQKFTSDIAPSQVPDEELRPPPFTVDPPYPESIDWRTKGAVSPVKNQLYGCISGWDFAAVAALESLNMIRNPARVGFLDFSEQQIIDCGSVISASQGCRGGTISQAFDYAYQYGLMDEESYPYTARDGKKCLYYLKKTQIVLDRYYYISSQWPEEFKYLLVRNPIAVQLQADQEVIRNYKSGVIGLGCGANPNHYVLMVGYQKVNDQEAFIVKNSWGPLWGMQGYGYISTSRQFNDGKGACGILTQGVFPFYGQL